MWSFLKNPMVMLPIRYVIVSQTFGLWQVLHAIWVYFYIQNTVPGIYVSKYHRIMISFLMAILNDPLVELFIPKKVISANQYQNIQIFLAKIAIEFIVLIFIYFSSEEFPKRAIEKFNHSGRYLFSIIGAMCATRSFFLIIDNFKEIDYRVHLLLVLIFTLRTEFIDMITRKMSRKRAQTTHTTGSKLTINGLAVAICYELSHKSNLSDHFGYYPTAITSYFYLLFILFHYISCTRQIKEVNI